MRCAWPPDKYPAAELDVPKSTPRVLPARAIYVSNAVQEERRRMRVCLACQAARAAKLASATVASHPKDIASELFLRSGLGTGRWPGRGLGNGCRGRHIHSSLTFWAEMTWGVGWVFRLLDGLVTADFREARTICRMFNGWACWVADLPRTNSADNDPIQCAARGQPSAGSPKSAACGQSVQEREKLVAGAGYQRRSLIAVYGIEYG